MEMSSCRPESHVAQQSRRDKLRILQGSSSVHHLDDFPNSLERLSAHPELNPDLVHVRNVRNGNLLYDHPVFSTEAVNFAMNSNVLSAQRDAMVFQEPGVVRTNRPPIPADESSFVNLSHPILSNFVASPKTAGDPHGCDNWRSLDSHQSSDWMVNYASGSTGRESNNQKPVFVGEVLSNSTRVSNMSISARYLKPSYNAYQDVHSTLTDHPSSEISGQGGQKQFRDMQTLYPNTLQDVVAAVPHGTQGLEMASLMQQKMRGTGRVSWAGAGNELVFIPSYENQSTALPFDNASAWINRSAENYHQWGGELGFLARKSEEEMRTVAYDANTQGLSLSLSSNPPPVGRFGEGYETEGLHSRTGDFKEPQHPKALNSGYMCSMPKPSIISKAGGKSLHDLVGTSTYVHQNTGPLGPFTGYATILKSSRFLKPAKDLLDEFCSLSGSKLSKTCGASERTISGEVSVSRSATASADAITATGAEISAKGYNSGVSSSTFYSSTNEVSGDGGVGSSSCESYRPEYQQKRAKLLYLQEEVCRRYKQYHQQMQMVVSSFESVAGLSAATPYVSLALKSVSRNFRCLKHAITDQIKNVTKALGEDLLSPTTGTSRCRGETTMSSLKYLDHGFQKHNTGGGNVGFREPQQHVWRPQRGLPERSVAILRAWLFEHFLHPYPTDTDKHMLATQTGLSRNQVSNWFINARVRVWKPMVEEIHMLETKGLAEGNQNAERNDRNSTEGTSQPKVDPPSNKLRVASTNGKEVECLGMGYSAVSGDGLSAEQWNQEKRSRMEFQVSTSMDGSLMGLVPYERSGLEIGGVGAVSLTLGLRHGVETAQQQQQFQPEEDQLRRQFGGQMIHDFVG